MTSKKIHIKNNNLCCPLSISSSECIFWALEIRYIDMSTNYIM
jgi:hypothetical protein